MATINEVIKAYYLHRSQVMMNFLNSLHKKYSMSSQITPKMAINIFQGAHQKRIKYNPRINYPKLKKEITRRLVKSNLLSKQYNSFEDLYGDVKNLLYNNKKMAGIGLLTVYDIALRIGYIRQNQLLPDKKIYLFAGANNGVNNLSNKSSNLINCNKNKNGNIVNGVYDMTIFSPPLSCMPSMFLEDLLCVYHKELSNFSILSYSDFQ